MQDDNVIPSVLQPRRQVFQPPFGKAFVIAFWSGKLHQMSDTPADKILATFQITILAFVGTDDLGQRLSDRRLFGNDKFHFVHPPSS